MQDIILDRYERPHAHLIGEGGLGGSRGVAGDGGGGEYSSSTDVVHQVCRAHSSTEFHRPSFTIQSCIHSLRSFFGAQTVIRVSDVHTTFTTPAGRERPHALSVRLVRFASLSLYFDIIRHGGHAPKGVLVRVTSQLPRTPCYPITYTSPAPPHLPLYTLV